MPNIYVATTGSDVTGDGTSGNPYATISHAVTQAVSGDEVLIGAGTYPGALTINKSVTLRSQNGVKTDVVISHSTTTITVPPSTSNVYIRDLTITTTDTVNAAINLQITRDFSVNSSGLPDLSTQVDNFNLINCVVNYDKAAVTAHARNSRFLSNTLVQTGDASSHRGLLLYSIDNVTINDNVHETATAALSSFIYLTIIGGGEYRKNTLQVKNNLVNVVNAASSGHFLLCETTNPDPADPSTKFRIDFQHNTFVTIFSPLDTGGMFIIFPTSVSNFIDNFDSVNCSIVANNTVTNPYRGWVYFDIGVAEPAFSGSTYFRIYGNTATELVPSYRPGSWDVDTPSSNANILVSATPDVATHWPAIYITTVHQFTSTAPLDQVDADNKLRDLMTTLYPGDISSIPLSLFSINGADNLEIVQPISGLGSGATSTSGAVSISCPSIPSGYKLLLLVLVPPYPGLTDSKGSFAIKVYNTLTGEVLSIFDPVTLRFDAGAGNEGLTMSLSRYVHPNFIALSETVTEVLPHIYEFSLTTNSVYNLSSPTPTSGFPWHWVYIPLIIVLSLTWMWMNVV